MRWHAPYDGPTERQFKPIARFWSPLDGVGQPLQILTQRGLGARQQVGSRPVATALREPLRVGFVGQLEVHKLLAERQHGGAGGESGRDEGWRRR